MTTTATTGTEAFKSRDAEVYSALPEVYTEYVHRVSHFIIDEICELAELEPGLRVLDVGSGTGMATSQAAEAVAPEGYVLGIDHSEGLVRIARAGAPRGLPTESLPLEYLVMDAENLELPDASFDVVISFSSIMHFPNPGRAAAEMLRVLRPGGRLVLSFTAIRPLSGPRLLRHWLRRIRQRLMGPPVLFAPAAVEAMAERFLPPLGESAEPTWSATPGGSRKRILAELSGAGFLEPDRVEFVGRDVVFSSPEEYFEAQLMISSDLRTRASLAGNEAVESLRAAFVEKARQVLQAGGKLLYPFGAVILRATRPA